MSTIFITGASSGIGKATVRYFRERGWNVAAAVRKPESVADLAALERVRVYRLDVTAAGEAEAAIAKATQDFGGIDVLVNNAGYAAMGPFEATSEEQLRRQFETNVLGLMGVTRAIIPHFRARRSGTIVNVSSIGGQLALPLYSLYHGTKWAVEGFSESLQFELRPFGIKIRIIEPGVIATDFYARSLDKAKGPLMVEYEAWASRVEAASDKLTKGAPGPEVAAACVWRASVSRGWKLRWLVGKEGPLVFARRLMPNAWFRGLVRAALRA